uniref:TonB dependent receptor n=1 Tax=Candidatus Kentrum sp. UNK TaxID=2126344 RepID=A0A451B6F1_9GAMM|nr:MAG: TonB dependent receptor [Candidatus Kentron sp. UNK]VFK73817.1 MAG: TonB dependent receptor [Candidatus Kentron sp. UNK]
MDATLRVDAERRGKKYWHTDNAESQAPFNLYNARLTLEKGDFQVAFWGKNLTNEKHYTEYFDTNSVNNPPFGLDKSSDSGGLGQLRTFGVDVRYDF